MDPNVQKNVTKQCSILSWFIIFIFIALTYVAFRKNTSIIGVDPYDNIGFKMTFKNDKIDTKYHPNIEKYIVRDLCVELRPIPESETELGVFAVKDIPENTTLLYDTELTEVLFLPDYMAKDGLSTEQYDYITSVYKNEYSLEHATMGYFIPSINMYTHSIDVYMNKSADKWNVVYDKYKNGWTTTRSIKKDEELLGKING